jgi:hypothetical protein
MYGKTVDKILNFKVMFLVVKIENSYGFNDNLRYSRGIKISKNSNSVVRSLARVDNAF